MMSTSERSPLVDHNRTYQSIEAVQLSTAAEEATDISHEAQSILHHFKTRDNAAIEIPPSGRTLPVLLYALYLNQKTSRELLAKRNVSSRERVNITRQRASVHSRLEEEATKYLDGELDNLPSVRETIQTQVLAGEAEGPVSIELEEFEAVLWETWKVQGWRVSCLDLMLPPYTTAPSPLLAHPLIIHSLARTWTQGVHSSFNKATSSSLSVGSAKAALQSYITPRHGFQTQPLHISDCRRSHLLLLISHIVLLSLTLMLTINPRDWLSPLIESNGHPGVVEAVYIVWAFSTFLGAFPQPLRALFLLPSALGPILAHFNSDMAWSTLTFSIFPLTIYLILPNPPSFVFLSSDFVPLSTLLRHILSRGIRSGGLMLPLILVAFMIFAWSLNGDIFRVFTVLATKTDQPVEEGIAPFETRVWLFITFAFLLITSISLTTVRLLTSPYSGSEPGWETEYGPTVALMARERWTRTVRDSVVRREIVPPFNLYVDVIPSDEILFLYAFCPERWKSQRLERWMSKLEYARDTIWIFCMGPMCFPLYLVDRMLGQI